MILKREQTEANGKKEWEIGDRSKREEREKKEGNKLLIRSVCCCCPYWSSTCSEK